MTEEIPPTTIGIENISDPTVIRERSRRVVGRLFDFAVKAGPAIAIGLSDAGTSPVHTALLGAMVSVPVSFGYDMLRAKIKQRSFQSLGVGEDIQRQTIERDANNALFNAFWWGVRGAGVAWAMDTPFAQKFLSDMTQFVASNFTILKDASISEKLKQASSAVRCITGGAMLAGGAFFHHEIDRFMKRLAGEPLTQVMASGDDGGLIEEPVETQTRADRVRSRRNRLG